MHAQLREGKIAPSLLATGIGIQMYVAKVLSPMQNWILN